jgi:hypothetical protein
VEEQFGLHWQKIGHRKMQSLRLCLFTSRVVPIPGTGYMAETKIILKFPAPSNDTKITVSRLYTNEPVNAIKLPSLHIQMPHGIRITLRLNSQCASVLQNVILMLLPTEKRREVCAFHCSQMPEYRAQLLLIKFDGSFKSEQYAGCSEYVRWALIDPWQPESRNIADAKVPVRDIVAKCYIKPVHHTTYKCSRSIKGFMHL